MVELRQGHVYWTDFGEPVGSEPGYKRPSVVVQRDELNRSRIATTLVVVITSNLALADATGNVRLRKGEAGLSKPSVANVTAVVTVDRSQLLHELGEMSREHFKDVIRGIGLVMGVDRILDE